MTKNLGKADRIVRTVGAIPLTTCALAAPYPLTLRLVAFALPALYLAATALIGACAFYALTGRNTCTVSSAPTKAA